MKWPISWSDVKDHIDDIEDGIDPKLLPGVCLPVVQEVLLATHDNGTIAGEGYLMEFVGKYAEYGAANFFRGWTYRINWDGKDYDCVAKYDENFGSVYVGDARAFAEIAAAQGGELPDNIENYERTGEPFYGYTNGQHLLFFPLPGAFDDIMNQVPRKITVSYLWNTAPTLDCIYLRGADGKKYRLLVTAMAGLQAQEVAEDELPDIIT